MSIAAGPYPSFDQCPVPGGCDCCQAWRAWLDRALMAQEDEQ